MPKFYTVVPALFLIVSPVPVCGDLSSCVVPATVTAGGVASRLPAAGAPAASKNTPVIRCGYYRNGATSTFDVCNGQINNWIR